MLEAYKSLFKNINRHKSSQEQEEREGVLELADELRLEMEDSDLIELKKEWEKEWEKYYPEVRRKQDENEKYWLGKHFEVTRTETDRPLVDNVLFEAVETFLPIATKRNPEPIVRADNTKEGVALSKKVQSMLVYLSDILHIKLKLKTVIRYWALYLLGVVKLSWSLNENEIMVKVLRPHKLILDPDGTIDEGGNYTGEYIGEYKREKSSDLIKRFPKKSDFITKEVQGKMGTKVSYIEWWTDEILFWTLKDEVLGKVKNPHFNYDGEENVIDEYGQVTGKRVVPARNHFKMPKKPYVFFSVFILGKHPFDDTSLIGQNLANQDVINKRQAQIDRNIDGMNGGWIVSGELSGLTQEQATMAIEAARKGGGLWIAQGNPANAVTPVQGNSLPGDVFNHLIDTRNELRNIFGTRGSTPQGTVSEDTVGGKVIIREQDSSRIGGGISEYLEQFVDSIFNYMVQMMYVYYDEPHVASIIGKDRAMEYTQLSNADFDRRLLVSVKEGSMLPKDDLSLASQAMTLAQSNLIDPISLYDKLDFSDPQESAERLYVWNTAPQLLFPEAASVAMRANQAMQAEQAATDMVINEEAMAGQQAITSENNKVKK